LYLLKAVGYSIDKYKQAPKKEVCLTIYIKKVQTGAGKQTNKTRHKGKDRPFMNQRVCLDHEKCEEFLFVFLYFYLHHNLDIIAYK